MRLMILGATGGIGRLLVSGALEEGHEVTAFVRSPEKVRQKSPRGVWLAAISLMCGRWLRLWVTAMR